MNATLSVPFREINRIDARTHLRNHARGAMLGLALGDALGATVEFMTPREIRTQYGCHKTIRGGGWLRLPPGQVTDDTTMAFSLAEAWVNCTPHPSAEDCARAFDGWMKSKPVDIGNTVRRGIVRFRNTGEACVPVSEEAGNGATMRCTPVALVLLGAPPDTVSQAALVQSRVTHNNPLTDAATVAVVNMIQAGIDGTGIRGVMAQANQLARQFPQFCFRGKLAENPSGYIIDTMRTVLQAIDVNDNFEAALVDVVNRGGDADTTGAIAGTIMGALAGEEALPAYWIKALNPLAYSRCITYADALIEKAPAWQAH
jgi:ADP-ribosyl-[dinitrogen reductase] hydrolase